MIHVFHGFLGSPEDFSYLKNSNVILHDLLDFNPQDIFIQEEDTLIGYSMGGRVALRLAQQLNFKLKHLVLLSSHPGLETDEERKERGFWENQVLEKMNTPSFLEYWNSLPLFKNDKPIEEIPQERLTGFKLLFDEFRLSHQDNFLPLLSEYKQKVIYLIGQEDEKYKKLSQEKLIPLGLRCHLVEGGHRLFNHPESVLNVLSFEGIL
jgi:2-succinyl-6-hydroxy-2,4-cyclohexadiene-1-carboxylate synthase